MAQETSWGIEESRRRSPSWEWHRSRRSLYTRWASLSGCPSHRSPFWDAKKVNGSAEAYAILNTPDAVLGLGSYAATLGLIAMGGPDRARSQPWIPLALAAKSSLDSFQAGTLTGKSWCKFRAFSLYSLVTALCTFLVLPFVLPEARAAWKKLKGTR